MRRICPPLLDLLDHLKEQHPNQSNPTEIYAGYRDSQDVEAPLIHHRRSSIVHEDRPHPLLYERESEHEAEDQANQTQDQINPLIPGNGAFAFSARAIATECAGEENAPHQEIPEGLNITITPGIEREVPVNDKDNAETNEQKDYAKPDQQGYFLFFDRKAPPFVFSQNAPACFVQGQTRAPQETY